MSVYTDLMEIDDHEERLKQAMLVVEALVSHPKDCSSQIKLTYPALTIAEARVASVLLARPGSLCTHEAIDQTLDFMGGRISNRAENSSVVKVQVCRVRKKYPDDLPIKTVWGQGYYLESSTCKTILDRLLTPMESLNLADVTSYETLVAAAKMCDKEEILTNRGSAWSVEEVEQLRKYMAAGWDMPSMVDELNRTSRAIRDQCKRLGLPFTHFRMVWL